MEKNNYLMSINNEFKIFRSEINSFKRFSMSK